MVKPIIKPPYMAWSLDNKPADSDAELRLMAAVDGMMLVLRGVELDGAPEEEVLGLMQKHVEAAYNYYSSFSKRDIANLDLLREMLASAIGEMEDGDER